MPTTRTFPGIAFRVETPTTVELPRMDIAGFVGFAQRGPLQVPVVVESYPDFVNLFGGLYRLAWDQGAGLWQTACLAPAVKAFFAQGGRRCWVVRVASGAATTTPFSLPGLLQTTLSSYTSVQASARCPGSWADGLQAAVEPLVTSLGFPPTLVRAGGAPTLTLIPQGGQGVEVGDLLQLDFSDRYHRAYAVVPDRDPASDARVLSPRQIHWFRRLPTPSLPLTGTVHTVGLATTDSTSGSLDLPPDAADTGILTAAILTLSSPLAVESGDWLRLETGDDTLWLLVESATRSDALAIASVWAEGSAPDAGLLSLARLQRIQLALRVRSAEGSEEAVNLTLPNLAAAAPHPRFMGYLPADGELLTPDFGPAGAPPANPAADLWREVSRPRFPLSLRLDEATVVLPLGLDGPTRWRSPQMAPSDPLVQDGLVPDVDDYEALTGADWASFFPTLFLDSHLRFTSQRSLLGEASDRLYLQGQPLQGIHALFPIDDISLIALPDAAHPGWRLTQTATVAPPSPPGDPELLDPCAKTTPFTPCTPPTPPTPPPSPSPQLPTPTTQWQLLPSLEYTSTGLLEIQRAAARLAAAQSDRIAILGLPKHYRLPETLEHQQQLLSGVRQDGDTTDSYIALYHPWLISRQPSGDLIHTHPAGSMAGVMAARSLNRGAWIAPANEVLQDTLATLPSLSLPDEHTLYGAGINPIRQTPQGFVAWGSYTQNPDPELEDLNVRRLLILLRRLALREGQTYVFAPHSAAFRRRVQQQFEQVLARLFELGAFAGRVPAEAYQVVIDGSLNTPNAVERGQLIIELRVAPAQPLTFITVRLVQLDGNQLTVQEVRTNGG